MKNLLVISPTNPNTPSSIRNVELLLSAYPTDEYCILTRSAGANNTLNTFDGQTNNPPYYYFDTISKSINNPKKRPCRLSKTPSLLHRFVIAIQEIVQIVLAGYRITKQHKSEMLVGVSDRGTVYLGTFLLSKIAKMPYALLVFDVYSVALASNYLKRLTCLFFERLILKRLIFRYASKVIVTNAATKKFLEKKYLIRSPIIVIHNSAIQRTIQETSCHSESQYVITFTGSIYTIQRQAIINLITAITLLRDMDITFRVYTKDEEEYENLPLSNIKSRCSTLYRSQDIANAQACADILYLPLSWDTGWNDIIATATPGKLSDYLAAGKPILLHAPTSAYLVQYARRYGFAEIVDENDIAKLARSIRKLLTDKQYRARLVVNAEKTFLLNHDANKNAKKFASLFS